MMLITCKKREKLIMFQNWTKVNHHPWHILSLSFSFTTLSFFVPWLVPFCLLLCLERQSDCFDLEHVYAGTCFRKVVDHIKSLVWWRHQKDSSHSSVWLKSAGAAFRIYLASSMESMGYLPCRADPDLWPRPEIYQESKVQYSVYILCYVDDILCIHHNADGVL